MRQGERKCGKALSGTMIAMAAAALFSSGHAIAPASAADDTKVKCVGVDACKGKKRVRNRKERLRHAQCLQGRGLDHSQRKGMQNARRRRRAPAVRSGSAIRSS